MNEGGLENGPLKCASKYSYFNNSDVYKIFCKSNNSITVLYH